MKGANVSLQRKKKTIKKKKKQSQSLSSIIKKSLPSLRIEPVASSPQALELVAPGHGELVHACTKKSRPPLINVRAKSTSD